MSLGPHHRSSGWEGMVSEGDSTFDVGFSKCAFDRNKTSTTHHERPRDSCASSMETRKNRSIGMHRHRISFLRKLPFFWRSLWRSFEDGRRGRRRPKHASWTSFESFFANARGNGTQENMDDSKPHVERDPDVLAENSTKDSKSSVSTKPSDEASDASADIGSSSYIEASCSKESASNNESSEDAMRSSRNRSRMVSKPSDDRLAGSKERRRTRGGNVVSFVLRNMRDTFQRSPSIETDRLDEA